MVQKEFREPPRYMVGDIVYSHGFICIVCSIYPFNIDYSYDLKVIDGQSLGKICQKDIMHVHIWEEFLKKNGWKKEMYHDWRHYFLLERNILYLSKGVDIDGALFTVCVGLDMSNIASISFVHQLQNLLFGLGLNSEMEV